MKKINYLIVFVLMLFVGIGISNAAELRVVSNKSSVVVGNSVTITVTAKDAAGWEYCLNYDSDMFVLDKTTSDTGGACVKTGSTLIGYNSVTYTLKAKKSGTSKVSLRNYAMYNDNGDNVDVTAGGVTITARTQAEIEASYSTNADLKLLDVDGYDITPAFDKDTTEYTLEVANDVEKINIIANRADNTATVSGSGEKELLEGSNKFEIVVTAEKGNKKTYTLTVTRKELNPIKRLINGTNYTVVRKTESLEIPKYYTLSTVTIDGEEVPAFKSEITKYTLVALKDENGNVEYFKYENEFFKVYTQLSTEVFTFIVEETKDKIDGFDIEKEITINNEKVTGYVAKEDSEYVIMYGMNANTGEKGWYLYDVKDKTFQRYNEDMAPVKDSVDNLYLLLTIVFASISGIAIILLICLMSKINKMRENNQKLVGFIEKKKEKKEQKIDARFDSFSDTDEEEARKKLDETIHIEPKEDEHKLKEFEETEEINNIEDAEQALLENISKSNEEAYDNEEEIMNELEEREQEDKKTKKNKKNKKHNMDKTDSIEVQEEKEESTDSEETEKIEEPEEKEEIDEVVEDKEIIENKEEAVEESEEETDSFTQNLINDSVPENISKRELRRLEKIRRQEEKKELKKMQDDFFGDDN